MKRKRVGSLIGAATLLVALTACNSPGAGPTETPTSSGGLSAEQTAPLTEQVTLHVGSTYNLANGVVVVANELGYFEEENLKLEVEVIVNSQDAIALLAQRRYDVITGAISAGMLNSIALGLDIRVVSAISNISAVPGVDEPAPSGLFVRKSLYDSGEVTELADLKGRTVASVGGIGAAASYLVGLYAEQGGLTLNDLTLNNLSSPDSLAALTSGAVDAAYLTAPFSLEAVSSGVGVELVDAREVYGAETQAALLFGPKLLRDDPRVGAAFMRALKKAADRMAGDYRDDAEIVTALKDGANLTDDQIQDTPPYFVDLQMNPATLEGMQRMFLDLEEVLTYTEPLPISAFLDTRFGAAAGVPYE